MRILQRINGFGEVIDKVRELETDEDFEKAVDEVEKDPTLQISDATGRYIVFPVDVDIFPEEEGDDDLPEVDVIAAGYDWMCPNCGTPHRTIEYLGKVQCTVCGAKFNSGEPNHAWG